MLCSITNLITETKHTKVYRGRRKLTLDFFVVKSVSLTQKDRAINEVCCLGLHLPHVAFWQLLHYTKADRRGGHCTS